MKHKSIGKRRRQRNAIIRCVVLICIAGVVGLGACWFAFRDGRDAKQRTASETSGISVTETARSADVVTETTQVYITPTPVSTLSPTPIPTPTPTPQVYLVSLDGYAPGDVIDDELIDAENLGQYFTISEIQVGDNIYQRIYGQSYVDNNDISLSDLRYIKLLHVNFDGNYQVGELIVNAQVGEQVTDIFEALCEARYEIYSILLIDDFWVGNGTDSDSNSIEHNNTSCFCYRPATGSSNISRHALGLAIDINPQQNPYVRVQGDGSLSYSHDNASEYVYNRTSDMPHVITEDDYAYQLFTSRGWTWGGSWNNPIDYQHFQYS